MKQAFVIALCTLFLGCEKKAEQGASQAPAPAEPSRAAGDAPAKEQPPAPKKSADAPPTQAPTKSGGPEVIGSFTMQVPGGWTSVPVTSSMRAAHWTIADDVELIVYYFGQGGAGGVEANLARWYSQFQQADGSATKDKAKTESLEADGLTVTIVDVSGKYVAAVRPGAPEKHEKDAYRMLAAIVAAPDGPYYFKLLGPDTKVGPLYDVFKVALGSIKKKS